MRRRDEWVAAADEAIDLERLSISLLTSGVLAAIVALIGVRWPEPNLMLAVVAGGGVIGTFGIFDLAASLVSGTVPSVRAFFIGHGLASVGFGVLTASIPVASAANGRLMATAWLWAYAAFLALLTWRLWFHPHARSPLLAWCAANALLAATLEAAPPLGSEGLLYAAAAYMGVLGIGMLVAGLAMRHEVMRRRPAPRHP